MPKKPASETGDQSADEPTAIYEVICHSVEIDNLICYRTHRLRLTKAKADAINEYQPDSVKFIGV